MSYDYDRRAAVKNPKTKKEWDKALDEAEEKHRTGKMTTTEWMDFNREYKKGIKNAK